MKKHQARRELIALCISALNQLDEEDENDEVSLCAAVAVLVDGQKRRRLIEPGSKAEHKVNGHANFTIPTYSPDDFKEHFRVSKTTFEVLVSSMNPILLAQQDTAKGRPQVDVKTQLLVALWALASQESFRGIGDRFNVCRRAAWLSLMRVVKVLLQLNEDSRIIQWPTEERAQEIADYFMAKFKFPGIIGCLDSKHIPIKGSTIHPASYINHKKFHSIVLQCVCDHDLAFTHCYAGQVGSAHDSTVLKLSEVYPWMLSGERFPDDTHIIGDSGYPIMERLMIPFRNEGYYNANQCKYNNMLSQCRASIGQAFALLVGRFQRLKFLDMTRIDLIPCVVMACCVLHNICISNGDKIYFEYEEDADIGGIDYKYIPSEIKAKRDGELKRYRLLEQLCR